jgi:adenylate kinase family enzyme
VNRVLIFGRGGSGKSTLAAKLGEITGLPVIELDKIFWQPGLQAMPRDMWVTTQTRITDNAVWIMDGDLGRYDSVEVRLAAADTIIVLDFSLLRCAWRAIRRGRERSDFWLWLLTYRRKSLPVLRQAFNSFAPHAKLHLIRNPRQLKQFIAELQRRVAK